MTLAEWRAANGFENKRGRPSAAEMAARKATGFTPDKASSGDAPKARPVQAQPAPVRKTDVIEPAERLWPENVVYKDSNGKVVSPSEVCVNCRASLPWCKHRVPVALGSVGRDMITRTVGGREFFGFLQP